MTTFTWAANSHAIPHLYKSLDHEFKARLDSNGCSLFSLLKLPISDTHTLDPLADILLSHYDSTQNVFIFGCHRLRITLEDVLFIAGLPISGKPVITSNNRDTDAFQRLFGPESNSGNSLTMMELIKSYATNKGLDSDKRMIAVLLYVISCFITPTSDVKTAYVEFVENLAEVDSYAWGAALLAFLYTGIKKWKDDQSHGKTKLSIHGNVWLLLCFFFIRIPKLMSAVGVELEWIVEKVRIVYKKDKFNYKEDVVNILNNLSDEDIRWLPYDSSWLPPRLQDQYRFRALVAPLFCNNYVVHHRPQLVPKQFGLTEGSVAGFERYDYEIKIQGPDNPDYLTLYKKEIEIWEGGKQLQDFISGKRSADVAEASSPPRKRSKLDVLHEEIAHYEEIARKLVEKLGTLTRLSKEENEQKIRFLESEINKSEAREGKLNSELIAALERNERFQGEVEKLMSEVRVSREMNVTLEGEIKSSEAREGKLNSELIAALERNERFQGEVEKLMSEVRVAREMNVTLEGEIKSSEAREKKLMSEVRAAAERNAKLKGGIKHAVSSLANLVKKSQDDDSTVHEAKGVLQEELHSEKHMVIEKSGKKDTAGKTELKSNSVGEESHVRDASSGKSTKFSSSSILKIEAEPKSKAKKDNEEATTKGTSSSKSSERGQGKGKDVTAVAEKQPSRGEMQSEGSMQSEKQPSRGIKHAVSSLEYLVKKSEEARDDDSTLHEAEGDLQEEVHPEKHMVVENSGKKDTAGNTELKSNSVGEESHVRDTSSGKSTKFSSRSISKKEAEPKSKAKKDNEEATTKGTSSSKIKSSKSSEREQGKGKGVTAVAEKQPSREEMHSVVADILKGVDLNRVTLSDLLKQLGKHFGVQVVHRKAEVRQLVTQVIDSMYHDEEAESGDESERRWGR